MVQINVYKEKMKAHNAITVVNQDNTAFMVPGFKENKLSVR